MVGIQGMTPSCTGGCEDSSCPSGYQCISAGQPGLVCMMGPCTSDDDGRMGFGCHHDGTCRPA